ncbi:OadG family protein [endosymbiont of Ridgeia piscesae]|jgi:sodium pump decarboxylase gamma subunit|uniref:Probable oxaloacetate decarboxylase gamma chain n=1 Tax=endosymbiont of Ridgeia piscesae TaxID=54398 RepID=A0A0T5YY45_9GAMM|nr:OadG family protein [endosymbiont of Ridgeia piscesae]KRT55441.1 sodium pump decarboxylase subunit gamma [endosymbiont of Ridgeia piscesae]KRT58986.1 oxaloacetate decarboxylase, gamma subunit [endosymbiont of Ridgeia piscesae]
MLISDLMLSGVKLMFLGMGGVFSFLVILVFTMLAMSRLAEVLSRSPALNGTNELSPVRPVVTQSGVRSDLVAVISAAITRYRTTQV